jgi:tRNA1Val (adenine37-N6)-methyltransferase
MSTFHFKEFTIEQSRSALKVGTDAMILGTLIPRGFSGMALDIGTGTGVLSLMVAQNSPLLHITAAEIDQNSCLDAQANFFNSKFSSQLKVVESDFRNVEGTFDLIISNPPFYLNGLLPDDTLKSSAKHSDSLSLNELFSYVKQHLHENGEFWCIYPFEHKEQVVEIAKNSGLHVSIDYSVNSKIYTKSRVVLCFNHDRSEVENYELTIRKSNGEYTDEYKELTKDFHGKKL